MRLSCFTLTLFCLATVLSSCDESPKMSNKEERFNSDDFFSGEEVAISLDSLKNEFAGARTDFLRSFAKDTIPWQKWGPSLLEKAKSAQCPIFVLVGSSLGGDSRVVAKEISETEKLREMVTRQSVCTVVDTHAYPEMGTLCFHLSNEIKRSTVFPMILWLSHEGAPLAWVPVGDLSGNKLEIVIGNAIAMVEDIWQNDSEYAVENSRSDNEARQRRLNLTMNELEDTEGRNEVFRIGTRQLSSLYSFGDKDLDNMGGLIPTSSLELLAIGSKSHLLTDAVRQQCREAAHDITNELIKGALKDHLNGSYFYARRTMDRSLSSFSQDLSSQARLAHTLIHIGTILDERNLCGEGLNILSILEKEWLPESLSSRSPLQDQDEPGRFLWNFKTLKKILSEEEMSLAAAVFSLKEDGNIPVETDPLGNYFQLNSIRRQVPLDKLTVELNTSESQLMESLNVIKGKLLSHRKEKTQFITESALSATGHALVLNAQIARANHTGLAKDLATAQNSAQTLLEEFNHPKNGFARLSLKRGFIPARCQDYASAARALFLLYQATLDENWLVASKNLLDEAMTKLASEIELLTEAPKEEKIVPLDQFGRIMVFGESSLGVLDLSLNRLFAVTGDEKYRSMLELQLKSLGPLATRAPVNHTDFLTSCALGQEPLLAVLQGDPKTPEGQQMLTILNSQKHLPFLTIRPAGKSEILAPLPEIEDTPPEGGVNVILMRGGKELGQASEATLLGQLLEEVISNNGP